MNYYLSICSFSLIFTLQYFNSYGTVRVISDRHPLQVLIRNLKVTHFKQAALIGFHSNMFWHLCQFSLPLSRRTDQVFLIHLLCIQSLRFPSINSSVLILFLIGMVTNGFTNILIRFWNSLSDHPDHRTR